LLAKRRRRRRRRRRGRRRRRRRRRKRRSLFLARLQCYISESLASGTRASPFVLLDIGDDY